MTRALRIGTRASPLALAQARQVGRLIERRLGREWALVKVRSQGDKQPHLPLHQAQQPGLFTRALERALQAGEIDVAVHSLKDLPLAQPEGAQTAIPERGPAGDLLLVKESHYASERADLPLAPGTRVGTSSPRRQAFLLAEAPEVVPLDLRGNVNTRLAKLERGWVEALLMAAAPFERLEIQLPREVVKVELNPAMWPPAPGQGALAVQTVCAPMGDTRTGTTSLGQTRASEPLAQELRALDHPSTRAAVEAERAVLAGLGGGCGLPLGAHAVPLEGGGWRLTAQLAGEAWRQETRPQLARVELEGKELEVLAAQAVNQLKAQLMAPAPSVRPAQNEPLSPPAAAPNGPEWPDTLRSQARPEGWPWLVAGTAETAARYAAALHQAGLPAAPWSVVEVEYLVDPEETLPEGLVAAWQEARWVLVASARAVPVVARLARDQPRPDLRYGAVGPSTAAGLRAQGLPVHLLGPGGTGASLAEELVRLVGEEAGPVLLPGAEKPSVGAREVLEGAGLEALPWPLYRTAISEALAVPKLEGSLAGVVVLSPSAARAVAGANLPEGVNYLALGPSTAAALEAAGLGCDGTAQERGPKAVIQLIRTLSG